MSGEDTGGTSPSGLDRAAAVALVQGKLVEVLSLEPAVVTPQANLQSDLSLTSLDVIEVLTALEDAAGVELGPAVVPDPQRIATVRALADLLVEVAAGRGRA